MHGYEAVQATDPVVIDLPVREREHGPLSDRVVSFCIGGSTGWILALLIYQQHPLVAAAASSVFCVLVETTGKRWW